MNTKYISEKGFGEIEKSKIMYIIHMGCGVCHGLHRGPVTGATADLDTLGADTDTGAGVGADTLGTYGTLGLRHARLDDGSS